MAARRVVSSSSDFRGISCPTGETTLVENKRKKTALSNRGGRSQFGKVIQPAHKRMSRAIGFCLTLGGFEAWSKFSQIAAKLLDEDERIAVAWAVLRSLSADQAIATTAAVLRPAGHPLPAFLGGMQDARFWASMASQAELKAYAAAAYDAMSMRDQNAFYQHIREVEIAA